MCSARYTFPDLQDLPEDAATSEENDPFVPMVRPNSPPPAPTSEEGDPAWQPMFRAGTAAYSKAFQGLEPRPAADPRAPLSRPGASPPLEPIPSPPRPEPLRLDGARVEPPLRLDTPRVEPPVPRVDPRELERLKAQARQEGYAEGLARGEAEGRAIYTERLARLESLIVSLVKARETLFSSVREDLVHILSLVSRRILRKALQSEPRAIVTMVGSVLEELPRQERVVVKVSADDYKLLEDALPDLRRRLEGGAQLELEVSAQVRDGAVIQLDGGRVDATIERQLETFEEKAREWLLGGSGALSPTVLPRPYSALGAEPDGRGREEP